MSVPNEVSKRQRIPNEVSKRQRIPNVGNQEWRLETGTQNEDKQNKNITQDNMC